MLKKINDEILSYRSKEAQDILKAIAIGPDIVTKDLAYALYIAAYGKTPDNFDTSFEEIKHEGLLTNPHTNGYEKQFKLFHDIFRDSLRYTQKVDSSKEKEIYLNAMEALSKEDSEGEKLLLLFGRLLKDNGFFKKLLCATKNESPLEDIINNYLIFDKYDKAECVVDCLLECKKTDNAFYKSLVNLKNQLVTVRVYEGLMLNEQLAQS